MNAGKGQRLCMGARSNHLSFPISTRSSATKLKVLVEKQRASGGAILDRECSQSPIFRVRLHHPAKIDRADHIDVVQDEWFVRGAGISQKEIRRFFQAAASVEQFLFARDFNPHAEVVIGLQEFQNHVRKVMDVNEYVADSKRQQSGECDVK